MEGKEFERSVFVTDMVEMLKNFLEGLHNNTFSIREYTSQFDNLMSVVANEYLKGNCTDDDYKEIYVCFGTMEELVSKMKFDKKGYKLN